MLLLFAAILCWAGFPQAGRCVPAQLRDEGVLAKALEYTNKNPETLAGLVDDEVAEGDMLLEHFRNAVDRTWPSTNIAYDIDYNLRFRSEDIRIALNMISFHTCLSFQRRRSEADYLFFKRGVGCASYVGFRGGKQEVHVGRTCMVGNIVHEVLHALGFYHEHTRNDRENYIAILPANIMKGHHKNFRKQFGETFQLPYDLPSIMHYGSTFFSANGRPTIVAKTKWPRWRKRSGWNLRPRRRQSSMGTCMTSPTASAAQSPLEGEGKPKQTPANVEIKSTLPSRQVRLDSSFHE
ncbi:astacin-like metalloprotease toxin 1 isoform X2 [Vanacampus margaritifer]